jgi:cobalamin biosynthetic protein CobC
VARLALRDSEWQRASRARLKADSQRLASLLHDSGLTAVGGTALFHYVRHPDAQGLHSVLAQQGIFTRLFTDPPALRFGLPGSEPEWQRLTQVLTSLQKIHSKKVV